MSLFEELKRRNVFRVGIAYLVVAWLLMQVADVVINNIGAPGWVFQVIMLLLGIGFPLVMIFAWAFEMTPEGIRKEKNVDRSQSITSSTGRKLDRMIIGIMAVIIAFLVLDRFVLDDDGGPPEPAAELEIVTTDMQAQAAEEAGPSVAVLPFVNMSGDKENEYFSDGLTETLLHMLAQLPDLRVAARTSSFAFKNQNKSVGEIAATLGVAHILEGSVQKSGGRVRITAQLIRADDGFHVWSQNYTRPLDDIFAIQDEIAGDVADALGASLLGAKVADLQAVNTTDLDAYDSYLKGLQQQAIFSYSSLEIAENQFKQALARDPAFTDARLALIRNYMYKNGTGLITDDELTERSNPLISQVREQQPDNRLARAFEIAISLRKFDLEKDKDERELEVNELRNLLPLLPGETYIREVVAQTLNFFFKHPQQAIEVIQAGLLVDPLAAELYSTLGNIYRDQDQLDQAREALQRAQQLAPENPNFYSDLAGLEQASNNLPKALDWQRKAILVDPQDHELVADLAQQLYYLELPEESDRWFARVKALVPGSAIAQMVELNRAVAKEDFEHALALSRSMISNQVDPRRGAFFQAVKNYIDIMTQANRSHEAFEFLVSTRPEILNYDDLPDDVQGFVMQWASITLMSGFESPEKQKEAWKKLTTNLDVRGFPWRDPSNGNLIWDLVITGQHEAAVEHFLNDRLSKPMALNLQRHKRRLKPLFGPVYDDPRVAARLAELDREFAQLREDIKDMMLRPEWNQ